MINKSFNNNYDLEEKTKTFISNEQKKFLSEINFDKIMSITVYREYENLIFCPDHIDNVLNNKIEYSIKYNDNSIIIKKEISKKIFEIIYTKPHFTEFFDDFKIIHFIKIL